MQIWGVLRPNVTGGRADISTNNRPTMATSQAGTSKTGDAQTVRPAVVAKSAAVRRPDTRPVGVSAGVVANLSRAVNVAPTVRTDKAVVYSPGFAESGANPMADLRAAINRSTAPGVIPGTVARVRSTNPSGVAQINTGQVGSGSARSDVSAGAKPVPGVKIDKGFTLIAPEVGNRVGKVSPGVLTDFSPVAPYIGPAVKSDLPVAYTPGLVKALPHGSARPVLDWVAGGVVSDRTRPAPQPVAQPVATATPSRPAPTPGGQEVWAAVITPGEVPVNNEIGICLPDAAESWKLKAEQKLSGANTPLERNWKRTQAYAELYQSDPEAFKWAGLAALASNLVGFGMKTATLAKAFPWAREGFEALSNGNQGVYDDIFWQHLAFQEGGAKEMIRLHEAGSLAEDDLRMWLKIDEGIKTGNQELVWEAARDQLVQEQTLLQTVVYDPAYEQFTTLSPGIWSPVPGDDVTFREYLPGGNIAQFDERFDWIGSSMLPAYREFEASGGLKRLLADKGHEPDKPWKTPFVDALPSPPTSNPPVSSPPFGESGGVTPAPAPTAPPVPSVGGFGPEDPKDYLSTKPDHGSAGKPSGDSGKPVDQQPTSTPISVPGADPGTTGGNPPPNVEAPKKAITVPGGGFMR